MYSVSCDRSTGLTPTQIRESRLFGSYVDNLAKSWRLLSFRVLWAIRRVTTNEVDIIMMFAEIEVRDEDGQIITSGALLRGSTVEVLPIVVSPWGERYVVLVRQSRVPVGRKVLSTPAGMTDGKSVTLTALSELDEEIGHPLKWGKPLWLNERITGSDQPMLVSPGGSSEDASFCAVEATVTNEDLRVLDGHVAGNQEEGEQTKTLLIPFDDLPHGLSAYGQVCLKTVMGIMMYRDCLYYRGGFA